MTYVQIDVTFPENQHIDALSDAAFRLHVAGICYAGRNLTDGFVPDDRIPRLVPRYKKAALDELINAGRWVRAVGGYLIHDYLKHQQSKAQVEKEREAARKRAHEWRTRDRTNKSTNSERTGARTGPSKKADEARNVASDASRCDEHHSPHPCAGCAADRKASA